MSADSRFPDAGFTDPRFEPGYDEAGEPKKKRSPWTTCLIGCLIVLALVAQLVPALRDYRIERA